jgi:hypothetical protein
MSNDLLLARSFMGLDRIDLARAGERDLAARTRWRRIVKAPAAAGRWGSRWFRWRSRELRPSLGI